MFKKITLLLLPITFLVNAQKIPIQIVTEEQSNRLAFYAINENDEAFDVFLNVSGANFKQSQARPRLMRLPGTSKMHLKTIITIRGKKPEYTYDLVVNDSLSPRAIKKEFTPIKVKPRKSITIYQTDACIGCDSIVGALERSKFLFSAIKLSENESVKAQLKSSFPSTLDSISTPIINLGGKLYTRIESYEHLITELNKD